MKKVTEANLRDEKYASKYAKMLEVARYWLSLENISYVDADNAPYIVYGIAGDIYGPMYYTDKYDSLTAEEVAKDYLELKKMLDALKAAKGKDKGVDNFTELAEQVVHLSAICFSIHSIVGVEPQLEGEKLDSGMEDFYYLFNADITFRLLHDAIEDLDILGKIIDSTEHTDSL